MGCQCSKIDKGSELASDFIGSYTEIVTNQSKEYPLLVYSQLFCKNSSAAKEMLRKQRVQFEYFELDHMNESDQVLRVLQSMTGRKSTPFVFVRGEYVGGLAELAKVLDSRDAQSNNDV